MKKKSLFIVVVMFALAPLEAQVEPNSGNWKPWLISSGKDYRLPAPPSYKNEVAEVFSRQQKPRWYHKTMHYILECGLARLSLAGKDEQVMGV